MIVTAVTMYVLSAMFGSVAVRFKDADNNGAIAVGLAMICLILGSVLFDIWLRG